MQTQQLLEREKLAYAKVEAPCPYFGTCGGCALQDVAYADQLALKRERIRQTLTSVADGVELDIVGLDDPWRYRNKAELTFGESDGRLILGYHAAGSYWRVIDLEDCLLLPEAAMRVVRDVVQLANDTGLPAYRPKTHQGFFRYLLVRHSQATGQVLLCLMSASGEREVVEAMARELIRRHGHLASLYWGLTDRLADIAQPDQLFLIAGQPWLTDRLGPFELQLHPLSFIQPSSRQADRVYSDLVEALETVWGGVAWDLYCGIGLIGLYVAQRFHRVYGIDVEAHHIELARRHAAINGVANIEFREGPVETVLRDRRSWWQEAKPDAIIVDPPRAGLHLEALSSILAARPQALAYVSCNAQSLARDLGVLCASYPRYRVKSVRAYDMFPQTNHAEVLAVLQRA